MPRLSSKNNFIIVGLVLFAGYIVYTNIVAPLVTKDEVSADRPDMFGFEDEEVAVTSSDSHANEAVEISVLYWNDTPSRDPFIYQAALSKESLERARKIRTVGQVEKLPDRPKLTGFIAGVESRLAVIDNRVVEVGQQVGSYTVLDIDADGVHLVQRESRDRLKLKLE